MVSRKGAAEISCLGIPSGEEEAEFIFCAGDVCFHRAERPAEDVGRFIVGEALSVADVENGLLVR